MKAGRLRHRVRIEQKSSTDDNQGGVTETWGLLDVVPAEVTPDLEGAENETASHTAQTIRHTVSMRYRTGVTPSMRLVFGERVLTILSVVNVGERDKELAIRCIEEVGEAA